MVSGTGYMNWMVPGTGFMNWMVPGNGYMNWMVPSTGYMNWKVSGTGYMNWMAPGTRYMNWYGSCFNHDLKVSFSMSYKYCIDRPYFLLQKHKLDCSFSVILRLQISRQV